MGWRVDSEIQQMLRDSARSCLDDKGGPARLRTVRETETGFDAEAWAEMAALGWTGIVLPEDMGGSGLGLDPALTIAEEMGRALAPEPFVASAVMAATVLAASSGEPAAALARALASGEHSVTLAWQEETGALGVPDFTTRLADGTLSGAKCHVPAWHPGTALLVAAASDSGPVVVVVDPSAPGVSVAARRMTDGSLCADLAFSNVAVSGDAVIVRGEAAREAIALAVARGTLALCAQLEGLSAALWELTRDHLKQRVQFDQPLADFQALRHRMVDLYAGIELAGASWRAGAAALDGGQVDSAALHAAKARCSDTAMEMGRWAIQYHGAMGFTDEVNVGLYVHCAMRWSSWLGNAAAHRRAAIAIHRNREAGRG